MSSLKELSIDFITRVDTLIIHQKGSKVNSAGEQKALMIIQ
jgi:hypothetical protein